MKKHDRSWLRLLAFLAMTTLASSLFAAAVLACFTVAVAGGEPPQTSNNQNNGQNVDPAIPGQTFSGFITDARCGPRHTDSGQSASGCARMCAQNGSKYIMVDGDRKYGLAGDQRQFDRFAGARVNLTGVLSGDTIRVNSASLKAAAE